MALAPMANVTDAAFRRIIAKYGRFTRPDGTSGGGPDIFFTEFVSADGLLSAGREKLLVDLLYSENERPIVAQLFSGNPEKMYEAAQLVKQLGFDGLDINMGCPDRSIEKSGAGAALIKDPARAREVIRAAIEGASGLPVSLKTRLGYNKDELESWLPELLKEPLAAVTIHARTRKEMSAVPARWDRVKRAVEIRNTLQKETLILGNGDVMSVAEANEKARESGADGVMLGRAIFGNPWLFQKGETLPTGKVSPFQKIKTLREHVNLFDELLGEHKNFAIMKKHFKAYVEGFDGAKELRMKLMKTESVAEVEKVVLAFLPTKSTM